MHKILTLALTITLAVISVTTRAASNENWSGIWSGTIGRAPVTVCRDGDFMLYYYNRYLRPITLNKTSDALHWDELVNEEITGRWAVLRVDKNKLTARWSKPDGSGELPIQLVRQNAASDTEHPCGDSVFYAPLQTKVQSETETLTFNGKRYLVKKISIPGELEFQANLFAPIDSAAHFAEARLQLEQQLNLSEPALRKMMHECRQGAWHSTYRGSYHFYLKPIFWSSRWLALESDFNQECAFSTEAAAVEAIDPGPRVYIIDMANGKLVDQKNWIQYEDDLLMMGRDPSPAVFQLLKSLAPGAQAGQACQKVYAGTRPIYYFYPTDKGMLFRAHFFTYNGETPDISCDEKFVVPFNSLLPVATIEGKEALRSLQRGD